MLSLLAQRRVQTGDFAPSLSLEIDGFDIAPDLAEKGSKVTFSVQEGESELEIAVHRNLDELVNSPVQLHVGYGSEMVRYFSGWLYDPETAYGPFKTLSEQSFPRDVDFRGYLIDAALYEIFAYAGMRGQQYEIRPGKRYVLAGDPSRFKKNVGLKEAIDQIVENAGRIYSDLPNGIAMVAPAPRPGSTRAPDATYDEDSLPLNDEGEPAFTASSGEYTRNLYSAVRVFRDPNDEGDPGVDVQLPVEAETRRKPPKNRYYEISEFTGDESAAWDVAQQYARLLARGTFACSLGPVPFNNVSPYDSVEATVEEREIPLAGGRAERWERTYSFILDDSIELELGAPHNMTMAGEGLLLSEKKLARPQPVRRARRETGYRAPFGTKPDGTHFLSTQLDFVSVDEFGDIHIDVEGARAYGFNAYMNESYEVVLSAASPNV